MTRTVKRKREKENTNPQYGGMKGAVITTDPTDSKNIIRN